MILRRRDRCRRSIIHRNCPDAARARCARVSSLKRAQSSRFSRTQPSRAFFPSASHPDNSLKRYKIILPISIVAVALLWPSASKLYAADGVLTLSEAIALTLENSPALIAEQAELRAGESHSIRAKYRPNPHASLQLENLPGNDANEAETTLMLSQVIELGGKRAARMAEARAANDLAAWDYEIRRLDVLSDVARKFIEVVVDQERLEVAKEGSELARAQRDAVKERVDAARSSAVELQRAEVAISRAKVDEEHAEHELLSARKTLAAIWGREEVAFARARADFFATPAPESFGSLMARVGENPDLARFAEEIRVRQAQLRLAQTVRVPDVTASVGLRQFASENDWAGVFGLSVPLPVFDRGRADEKNARELELKAASLEKAIRVQLGAKLFEEYQEMLHAVTARDIIVKEILPAARKILAQTEEGYRKGRFSYLELSDARRSLMELRRENIETVLKYHLRRVEIDRLIGAAALAPQRKD